MNSVLLDRFIRYTKIDSHSNIERGKTNSPSTYGQVKMIRMIERELLGGGANPNQLQALSDGSLLVHFVGTGEGKTICLAAHVDTYFGLPGGANPIVHAYAGGDIVLPEGGVVISESDLAGHAGKTVVTSDGTTTLGADDKSGVAILVQLALDIQKGEIKHGPLYLWLCVDEEISKMDVRVLPPEIIESLDILITVDGGKPEEVIVECLSDMEVEVEFFGEDAHSAFEGHKLKPAHYAAARLVSKLEDISIVPWKSFGRDGFIYADGFGQMTPSGSKVNFCLRSFESNKLLRYQAMVEAMTSQVARSYGVAFQTRNKVNCLNIKKAIDTHPHLLAPIVNGFKQVGIDASLCSGRYGTDGAMVNAVYPDLPAPDIGTGGYNVHSLKEFLVVEEMYVIYEALKAILPLYLEK